MSTFCDWCLAVYVAWLIMTGLFMLATSRIRKRVTALEARMQTMESLVRGEGPPVGPYRVSRVPERVVRAVEEIIAKRG